MREWKSKMKHKHRALERGIPLSRRDVEDILVALEARNEQWSISTTGWNKLVMNDVVDASALPASSSSSPSSSSSSPNCEAIPTPPYSRTCTWMIETSANGYCASQVVLARIITIFHVLICSRARTPVHDISDTCVRVKRPWKLTQREK